MASFRRAPGGPRLYAMQHVAAEGSGPANVPTAAFNDFSTWLTNVAMHDHLISLGVRWFMFRWLFGMTNTGAEYLVGLNHPSYGGAQVHCSPLNQVNHEALVGDSYLIQIVPALDTAQRKGQCYGYMIYSGCVAASSATDNATLDAHAAIARQLGAIPAYDAQSVLDYTNASNPHKMHVDRLLAAHGVRTYGESWERHDLPGPDLWVEIQSGIIADYNRAAHALEVGYYFTKSNIGARRAAVDIQGGPTATERFDLAGMWLRRGYDVVVEMGGMTDAQITALVELEHSLRFSCNAIYELGDPEGDSIEEKSGVTDIIEVIQCCDDEESSSSASESSVTAGPSSSDTESSNDLSTPSLGEETTSESFGVPTSDASSETTSDIESSSDSEESSEPSSDITGDSSVPSESVEPTSSEPSSSINTVNTSSETPSLAERRLRVKEDGGFRRSQFKVSEMPSVLYYRRNTHFNHCQFLTEPTVNWGTTEKAKGSDGVKGCRSVMLAAIRLAYYLGFRRLFLLGADFRAPTRVTSTPPPVGPCTRR